MPLRPPYNQGPRRWVVLPGDPANIKTLVGRPMGPHDMIQAIGTMAAWVGNNPALRQTLGLDRAERYAQDLRDRLTNPSSDRPTAGNSGPVHPAGR